MNTAVIIMAIIGVILASIFLLVLSVRLGAFTVLVQCPRCKLRIASVKVGTSTPSRTEDRTNALQDGYYLGRYVCGECWAELKQVGLDTDGNWVPGATVKYVKDTPGFLAVFISLGALVVSIIALLEQ